MSRTYRRCTNKKHEPKLNFNIDREYGFAIIFWRNVVNVPPKVLNYYKKFYYTSDRSFVFDSRPLKHDEKRSRRAHETEMLNKMRQDPEIFDNFEFKPFYGNPWDWD